MDAYLLLENGAEFHGCFIGPERELISEIVFNTSMSGYLELVTDPSYTGQAVVLSYPLIGNYGVCREDMESERPLLSALLVRELAELESNWRSEGNLRDFLIRYDIPGISGLDTRAVIKQLREHGTMNGLISGRHYEGEEREALLRRIRDYRVRDAVRRAGRKGISEFPPSGDGGMWTAERPRFRVALFDFGAKQNMIRSLQKRGCHVTLYPPESRAESILRSAPDGILLSNGPGDPAEERELIGEVRKLYESEIPIFAICLGHQLMALAVGAKTYRLKYGHRGGNQPVKELESGRVYISSQNHGYAVDAKSMDPEIAAELFRNVNDGSNEGFRYLRKRILSVQFHPEACPGPGDSAFLFDRFMDMMEAGHER